MPYSEGLVYIIKDKDNVNFVFNKPLIFVKYSYTSELEQIFTMSSSILYQQRKYMYTIYQKQVIFKNKCGPHVTYEMCNLAHYLIFGKRI